MATSRATFEKRIKELEVSLSQAASENQKLEKSLEKQEEEWKTRLVGGKITRYPKRRERRPAKVFKRGDGPEIVGRVTLMGQDVQR